MGGAAGYSITRLIFQRGLGIVYLIAFLAAVNQFRPLLGDNGLLPVRLFVKQVPFRESPSLFYLFPHDAAFAAAAWLGVALSCIAITGLSERYGTWPSVAVWTLLWVLYLSFVNTGQVFYGFGWESILLESGFFAIFLGSARVQPQMISIWILRWILFRVMFGAGLIKLRGDPCWHDLTCLDYHYETQPIPNGLSWFFHWAPDWTHRGGVLFNHFVELVAPFGYFLPQPMAGIAGLCTIAFQSMLLASGNLSWLNLLTIMLAIPTLDDRFLGAILPIRLAPAQAPSPTQQGLMVGIGIAVALLSIRPVLNMLSPGQLMNFNYNPLHLINTYGAFGSITRVRSEIVIEGSDEAVLTASSTWREYEFKGKPGGLARRPAQIAPYHLRLDWLMWFAAMGPYDEQPWFIPFLKKLLEGDREILSLMGTNPFPEEPPHYVRALLYEYHFTTPEERKRTGNWWQRRLTNLYVPPLTLEGGRLTARSDFRTRIENGH